ncbi:hypothetical protein [Tunturiibacter gelidoferens]|jgi:hypothetical protein|uniref:Uncharacterized protein n=1 Tax=Tunturiibacter gelidiferens TaxID=3069689 RepID=A0A9X0QFS0_9BACT|nr:hypothetical protein [Edaphobacter lichenicola]MBB5329555.1 hypothetical protein [Edaphobacter lichenicola]
MLLTSTLALIALAVPPEKPRPHISATQLNDIATILAHDEGWPLGDPDYTLDPMRPDTDDGFDSIGIYKKAHLVRMYSVERSTGEIVDFLRGCEVFRFEDIKSFQSKIRQQSQAPALTDQQLAAKAGCPKLTVVNTRWVH